MVRQYLLFIPLLLMVIACKQTPYSKKDFEKIPNNKALLVEMVKYMGKRPKNVPLEARFDTIYNNYYQELSGKFELKYYHKGTSNDHYFYAARPARNHQGDVNRGVGGRFTLDSDGHIVDFEEVFNTPIKPKEQLEEIGLKMFAELVKTGSVNSFLTDRNCVEWPSTNSKYNKTTNEWEYIN